MHVCMYFCGVSFDGGPRVKIGPLGRRAVTTPPGAPWGHPGAPRYRAKIGPRIGCRTPEICPYPRWVTLALVRIPQAQQKKKSASLAVWARMKKKEKNIQVESRKQPSCPRPSTKKKKIYRVLVFETHHWPENGEKKRKNLVGQTWV